jgi:hypothetical protein
MALATMMPTLGLNPSVSITQQPPVLLAAKVFHEFDTLRNQGCRSSEKTRSEGRRQREALVAAYFLQRNKKAPQLTVGL